MQFAAGRFGRFPRKFTLVMKVLAMQLKRFCLFRIWGYKVMVLAGVLLAKTELSSTAGAMLYSFNDGN